VLVVQDLQRGGVRFQSQSHLWLREVEVARGLRVGCYGGNELSCGSRR